MPVRKSPPPPPPSHPTPSLTDLKRELEAASNRRQVLLVKNERSPDQETQLAEASAAWRTAFQRQRVGDTFFSRFQGTLVEAHQRANQAPGSRPMDPKVALQEIQELPLGTLLGYLDGAEQARAIIADLLPPITPPKTKT